MNSLPTRFCLPPVAMFLLLASSGENLFAADPPLNLPPPASFKINFDRDIRPILETSCLRCHGPQKPRSHFRLDYREGALAGGDDNTNDIVPGDSAKSFLIAYVARQVPDLEMPPAGRGAPLTSQQVGLLRAWIDQGAGWHTTNQPVAFNLVVSPTLGGFAVSGNQAKFRELEGTKEGISGGVNDFSATEQISPTEKVSLTGHAIVPDQDFDFQLALDKTDQGFIHAGFDQWRKYYAADGGFDPAVFPSDFNSDRDLYVDNGRAWIDFGLDLPRWPQIVLGYEYQYRQGNESTLDWGNVSGNPTGKNIYPASQSLDEQTHSLKLDITREFDDWHLENNARLDFYTENNQGAEASFAGTMPDEFIATHDNYHQVQGMDTLMLEKQIKDWWFFSGGLYYSRLSGSDFFNQTTAFTGFSLPPLSSQQVTLSRQSEIFSLANLFTPLEYLTLSLDTQNEWTRENGFGEGIPDLELGGFEQAAAASSLDEFKASQGASFRFTKIPFSVIFGDARFSEDQYSISQDEEAGGADALQNETAADNFRYDLKTGFSTSPWRWVDWTTQYERSSSDTDYNHLQDFFAGGFGPAFGPTNGYPGFILDRTITSDQFETKLVLRPANWLKTTLTYQISDTDYSSKTDPAYDFALAELVSDGGFIAAGHSDLQTYGLNATITPWRRLYFSGAFTFSRARTVTADNGDSSIVPYEGNIITFNAAANYALNDKTSLQISYNLSRADYSENNAVVGIPAGLDYLRHDLIIGLTRKLTKNLSGTLRYQFSQYDEPSGGNVNNFTANGIMATLTFRWP
jgi:hypothetical protein